MFEIWKFGIEYVFSFPKFSRGYEKNQITTQDFEFKRTFLK
jgi:hypothetical protein